MRILKGLPLLHFVTAESKGLAERKFDVSIADLQVRILKGLGVARDFGSRRPAK